MNVQDAVAYLKMANQANLIPELVYELHTENLALLMELKKEIDFRIRRLEQVHRSKDGRNILLKDIEDLHLAGVIQCALRGHDKSGRPVIYSPASAQAYAMEFNYRKLDPKLISANFEPTWALDMMEHSWIVNTDQRLATGRSLQTLHTEPEQAKLTPTS